MTTGRTVLPGPSWRLADRAAGRDNNFNLIRMVAASAVLVSHAWPIALGRGTIEPFEESLGGITLGAVAVTVFFAISGFFIARSYDTRRDALAFLRARMLRLFPALIVVLLVTVAAGSLLTVAAPGTYWNAVPGYVLRNVTLFFLQYPLPGVFENAPYGPAINGSLWTLSHEVLCYMGVLAVGLAGLFDRPRLFALGLVAVAGLWISAEWADLPGRLNALARLALPFAMGSALWVWRDKVILSPVLALGLALAAALLRPTPLFEPALMAALTYGVFTLGYARAGLLAYNRLGDYSYGMYIYAFPCQQLVAHWGALSPAANIAASAPLTLGLAVLSWHLVERPAMGLRRFPFPRALTERS